MMSDVPAPTAPRVLFRCPVSEELVPTGNTLPSGSGRRVPATGTIPRCVACGRGHVWWRAETVIEGRTQRRPRRDFLQPAG